MGKNLSRLDGVIVSTKEPNVEAREPYIEIDWNEQYEISPTKVKQLLRNGEPSIEIRALFLSAGKIHLTATMLEENQAPIVVNRLKEILIQSKSKHKKPVIKNT